MAGVASVPRYETAFIPNGENRRDTLILLLGTAQEHDIPVERVRSNPQRTGFNIPVELADLLYDEPEPEEEPAKAPTKRSAKKKASGNRAAKNKAQDKE